MTDQRLEFDKPLVAADLGGSNARFALFDGYDLKVVEVKPTPARLTPQGFADMLYAWVDEQLEPYGLLPGDVLGIGLAIAGPVDDGYVGETPNIWAAKWVDMATLLRQTFDVNNVLIRNDCDAAVVGEHAQGAGRGFADVVYLTFSTGIGGGVVIRDELIPGSEPGHFLLDTSPTAPHCGCGVSNGHWESLAGGRALAEYATHLASISPGGEFDTYMKRRSLTTLTFGDVCEMAKRGAVHAPSANALVQWAATYLGYGIATIVSILRPKVIVVGGGMTKSWDILEPHIHAGIKKALMPSLSTRGVLIKLAELEYSALIGLIEELN